MGRILLQSIRDRCIGVVIVHRKRQWLMLVLPRATMGAFKKCKIMIADDYRMLVRFCKKYFF